MPIYRRGRDDLSSIPPPSWRRGRSLPIRSRSGQFLVASLIALRMGRRALWMSGRARVRWDCHAAVGDLRVDGGMVAIGQMLALGAVIWATWGPSPASAGSTLDVSNHGNVHVGGLRLVDGSVSLDATSIWRSAMPVPPPPATSRSIQVPTRPRRLLAPAPDHYHNDRRPGTEQRRHRSGSTRPDDVINNGAILMRNGTLGNVINNGVIGRPVRHIERRDRTMARSVCRSTARSTVLSMTVLSRSEREQSLRSAVAVCWTPGFPDARPERQRDDQLPIVGYRPRHCRSCTWRWHRDRRLGHAAARRLRAEGCYRPEGSRRKFRARCGNRIRHRHAHVGQWRSACCQPHPVGQLPECRLRGGR